MKYRGFVATVSARDGTAKSGKHYTAYSFKLENDDGSEGEWIGFGFERPPFTDGDYIEVEAEQKGDFLQYVKGSGTILKNPPARAAAKHSQTSNAINAAGNGVAKGGAAEERTEGQREQSADRQTQIVLQHSQEMAVLAVNVLLTHNGLPMSEAKSKAGTALRFQEITAMIDKLTRKFYDDVVTGQLLRTVAPELVSTEPDAPLPPPATEKPRSAKKVTVGDVNEAVAQPGVF